MSTNQNSEPHPFRFRTGNGNLLTDEIAAIEAMATKTIADGGASNSVQDAALALLKTALEGVSTEVGGVSLATPLTVLRKLETQADRLASRNYHFMAANLIKHYEGECAEETKVARLQLAKRYLDMANQPGQGAP